MEPDNYSYYFEKIQLLGALGKSSNQIIQWAQQSTGRISPEEYRYLIMAEAYCSANDYDTALEYIEKILSSFPRDHRLYLYSGIVLGRMGKHHQAREAFSRGLEINPENIDLQFNYALACSMAGDKEEAMKVARKILINAPYFVKARSLLDQLARGL